MEQKLTAAQWWAKADEMEAAAATARKIGDERRLEELGLVPGRTLVRSTSRRTTGLVVGIDSFAHRDRPWLKIRKRNRDGTFAQRAIICFDDWEIVPE